MKKIFCLAAAIVTLMFTGCKDYDSDITEINDRLDGIENTKIATIQSQIGAINTSLPKLENANKELGTYITALQNSTSKLNEDIATVNRQIAELKQSPESNNTKIDSVIVLIEQVKSDIQSELFAINTLVENLQNKDTELNGKVNDLQKYVDDELSEMEDWSLATFGTLEKQNVLISDVATIKAQITAITNSITALEARMNEKISTDIASAVATLNTTIQGKVQEITTNYTAALATAKEDITSAYTSAISEAIASLENSMKLWVNEQLKGYYTIAEIDSKLSVLQTFVADEDEKLQGEISDLTEALANARNELTTAYTNAIKAAIEENNGVIDNKIAGQIATVNSRIDNEIAAINLKIANFQSQIDKNSADIAKLLARIQSVSYVPKYSDGKATVFYSSSSEGSHVEFDFLVSPKSVVTEIAANYKNILAVKAVNTITRAVEFIDMPILSCVSDSTNGVITIIASAENLPETFFEGTTSASAALFISDGNINITSNYVLFHKKLKVISNNEIWYTTTDGQVITLRPFTEDEFGAAIVSNTYENGMGVIKFDGNVTSIGKSAFTYTSLKSITIPKSVNIIDTQAFYNANHLESVTFEENSQLSQISRFAFGCTNIKEITIPANVTSIGDNIFVGCKKLDKIHTHPQNKSYVTWDMQGYENVLSTKDAEKIIAYASGSKLTEFRVLSYPIIIGASSFCYCKNIKLIQIDIAEIESYNFYLGCDNLSEISLDETTKIGENVLNNCPKLRLIEAPKATSIGQNCFNNNSSLTEINLGSDELSIINYIGNDNAKLRKISLPKGITTISDSFNNCAEIEVVYIRAITPPALTTSFNSITDRTKIYVPTQSLDAYKVADGWKNYADKIVGYNFDE